MKNFKSAEFVHRSQFKNTPGSLLAESFYTDVWTLQVGNERLAEVYDYDLYKLIEGAINGKASTAKARTG